MTGPQGDRFLLSDSRENSAGRELLKSQEKYPLDVFALGFCAAFISGFFAITFLLRFLKKYPLDVFAYYRFLLAAVIVFTWARMGGM